VKLLASAKTEEGIKRVIEEFYYWQRGECVLSKQTATRAERYSVYKQRNTRGNALMPHVQVEFKHGRWRFGTVK
jgi:hypothetical protein